MTSPVSIQDLSPRWFERTQYRPLVPARECERWFILARREMALQTIEDADCRRRLAAHLPGREELAAVLESTYEDWDLPRAPQAVAGIERLGRDGTLCVVAGQQPGFLGGPLYVLYKALSAISVARWVEERHGIPCVPIFWVAGEDHDIDEVRTARFPIDGEENSYSLPHEVSRAPLSKLPIDAQSEKVLGEFLSSLGDRKHSDFVEELAGQYRGRTIASGFAALLAKLLGHHGLVFVDPEKLRPLARPILRRCIEHPAEVITQIENGAKALETIGLKPFVSTRFPLFLLRDGSRDHLAASKNGLCIDGGGPALDSQELLELLEKSPESFSAGALLRPVIQDHLLPTVATIGGPAEVGYFAQLSPLCKWLGVETPRILLRFQATVLEGEGSLAWDGLDIDADRLASASCAEDLVKTGDDRAELDELQNIHQRLESVGDGLVRENPDSRSLEKGLRKAQSAIDRLQERIRRLHARSDEPTWKNATTLWRQVLPGGALQERHWGYLHLIADHGTDWIGHLVKKISADPFSLAHHLVHFKP